MTLLPNSADVMTTINANDANPVIGQWRWKSTDKTDREIWTGEEWTHVVDYTDIPHHCCDNCTRA